MTTVPWGCTHHCSSAGRHRFTGVPYRGIVVQIKSGTYTSTTPAKTIVSARGTLTVTTPSLPT